MHIQDLFALHWGVPIYMIIFWLVLILGIVAILKWFNAKTRHDQSSIEILEKRYAKGEISKEDLDRIKQKITGNGH